MIKINWSFDKEYLKFSNIHQIDYDQKGVYVIYDSSKRPLYVGKAFMLRDRLYMHFKGQANTHVYSYLFEYCSVIYEEDPVIRDVFELYLIRKYDPPLNRARVCDRTLDGKTIEKKNFKKKLCKGTTLSGERCRLPALKNGYCHYHGKQATAENLLHKTSVCNKTGS